MSFFKPYSSVFKGHINAAPKIQVKFKISQDISWSFKRSRHLVSISDFIGHLKRTWHFSFNLLTCVKSSQKCVSHGLNHTHSHSSIQILDSEKNTSFQNISPLNICFAFAWICLSVLQHKAESQRNPKLEAGNMRSGYILHIQKSSKVVSSG